jgi:hypothetical protein
MESAPSDNKALIDFAERMTAPDLVALEKEGGPHAAILPTGKTIQSIKKLIDEYRDRPERREGIATLATLDSFAAHVNRFKDKGSAIFAIAKPATGDARAIEPPQLHCVYDYHEPRGDDLGAGELARFMRHRGVYTCPFSESWRAWSAGEGSKMDQRAFAEFIEDRIGDLLAPPSMSDAPGDAELVENAFLLGGQFCAPATLMELSRGIQVKVDAKVRQAVNLATGEIEVVYQTEHGEAGERMRVRNLFIVAIPVFEGGPSYRIIGRLRYRAGNGQLHWFYQLWRADRVFHHAFAELCAEAVKLTGLPLFAGKPEGMT